MNQIFSFFGMVIFWAYFKTLGGCTFWDDIYIIIIIIIIIFLNYNLQRMEIVFHPPVVKLVFFLGSG